MDMADFTPSMLPSDRVSALASLGTFFGLGACYIALCHKWATLGALSHDPDQNTQLTLLLVFSILLGITGLMGAALSLHKASHDSSQLKKTFAGLSLGLLGAAPPLWVFCQAI